MNTFGCFCQLALKPPCITVHPTPHHHHIHTQMAPLPPTWSCSFITVSASPPVRAHSPSLSAWQISVVCACHLLCYPTSSHHNNSSEFRSYFRVDCRFHMEIVHLYIVSHLLFGKKSVQTSGREVLWPCPCLLPSRGSDSVIQWLHP